MRPIIGTILGWFFVVMLGKAILLAWILMLMFGIVGLSQFGFQISLALVWLGFLALMVLKFKLEFTTEERSVFGTTKTWKGSIG